MMNLKGILVRIHVLLSLIPGVLHAEARKESRCLVFLGDSITQGGHYLAGRVPSYRYALFKHFVDQGIEFVPMGMTDGARGQVDVSDLTPPYRGVSFVNVSESAASGRSYQFAGHGGNPGYKADPGVVFPLENRGPVTLKLKQNNPFTKSKKTFYDGSTLKEYQGETYVSRYGDAKMDTLCVMIGINDMYDGVESDEAVASHVERIVRAYQVYQPTLRVHVFELLPTARNNGTGTLHKNNYGRYNEVLRRIGSKWGTPRSLVTVDQVSQGFYAEDGSMVDTAAGAHPNLQGELIVAGNMARAMGLEQRTAALERRAGRQLSQQVKFRSTGNSLEAGPFQVNIPDAHRGTWAVDAQGALHLKTPLAGGSDLRFAFQKEAKDNATPISIHLKMQLAEGEEGSSADAVLGVLCGNGKDQVAFLQIRENGIFWKNTDHMLYGSHPGSGVMAKAPKEIRVVWHPGQKDGVEPGYYVWLEDQLIGEALQGETSGPLVSHYLNHVLLGDIGSAMETRAKIFELGYELGRAHAPESKK